MEAGIVGRNRELSALAGLVDGAISHRDGTVVLVEGEPGIGKTTLLEWGVGRAKAGGASVVDPAHAGTGQTPVVVVIDDAHLADGSSSALLRRVVAGAADTGCLVLLAARPVPGPLRQIHSDAVVHNVPLGPLDDQAVAALAASLLHAEPGPCLRRELAWADGNPALVRQLVYDLERYGGVKIEDGHAYAVTETGRDLRRRFHQTVVCRLSYLPDEVLDVLRVAAVLGQRFSPAQLARALGRPVASLAATLRVAVLAGVLIEEDGGLAFRHPLEHEALGNDLPASVRADIAADLRSRLDPDTRNVDIVHSFVTGDWDRSLDALARVGSASAVDWSVEAIISVHRGDLGRAEQAATRADQVCGSTRREPQTNWAQWARALVLEAMGDLRAAHDQLLAAWRMCAAPRKTEDRLLLAPDIVRLARVNPGEIATAVEEVARWRPSTEWARSVMLLCRAVRDSEPSRWQAAVDAARRSGRVPLHAEVAEAAARAFAERTAVDESRSLFEEAADLYERLGARRDLARTKAELRALGVRRGQRGPRRPPGASNLTGTETRVVELVVQGLTNPQIAQQLFISPRTVQTHVSHALAKTGAHNRTELAARMSRQR